MFNHRPAAAGRGAALPEALLKQARGSGQLNLSGRNLGVIPDAVWRINVDAGKGQVADLSGNDDAWWSQVELTKLFVASNGLDLIPDDIELLPALVSVDAHDNAIASISSRLGSLIELRNLNLGYNKIAALPVELCGLPSLQVLRLEHNALTALPSNFGDLRTLVELDLSHNALGDVPPSVGGLVKLRKLSVSKNKLQDLPPTLNRLNELQELDASWNKLCGLPAGMSALRALVRIDLRYNALTHLPDLSRAAELREIQIGHNRITSLGNVESMPRGLRVLDIRDNKVAVLPPTITALQHLERLDLTNNDLSGLPAELGTIESLKSVVLDGNPVRSIRRDIIARGTMAIKQHLRTKLAVDPEEQAHAAHAAKQEVRATSDALRTSKALVFSGKRAESVPGSMWADAKGTDVASVVLSDNILVTVPLEVTLFATTLTTLDVSKNRLRELPAAIGRLVALMTLDCRWNSLRTLPQEIATCGKLKEALISGNRFSAIPDVLYSCHSLTALVAASNQISCIDVDQISSLMELSCLDVSNNAIGKVPPELGFIDSIKKLELHGNTFKIPRPAVLAKGTPAVMAYLRSRFA